MSQRTVTAVENLRCALDAVTTKSQMLSFRQHGKTALNPTVLQRCQVLDVLPKLQPITLANPTDSTPYTEECPLSPQVPMQLTKICCTLVSQVTAILLRLVSVNSYMQFDETWIWSTSLKTTEFMALPRANIQQQLILVQKRRKAPLTRHSPLICVRLQSTLAALLWLAPSPVPRNNWVLYSRLQCLTKVLH